MALYLPKHAHGIRNIIQGHALQILYFFKALKEKNMTKITTGDALHRACLQQETGEVHRLLTGIKPSVLNKKLTDYTSPLQGTPLHIACQSGNVEIVKLLVEAGADLEIKNVARQSALSIALANGHHPVAAYLIEAGADISSKGPNGLQPIHFACMHAGRDSIELLLSKGVDVNLLDSSKSSLLEFTTNLSGGNLEAAVTLVENGIDPNSYSSGFRWACWRNNPGIAEYLLEQGADYKSQTTPKSELLFWICGMGHLEIVELLLKLGVDFTTPVKFKGKILAYNGSPLERAQETGQTAVVELILAARH
ncbi:ankyrin repeat domain-containing protein [Paenibacillus oryzae]|nr:ankyrin repeat domain-containing protein [Paenibacillus oryzae]